MTREERIAQVVGKGIAWIILAALAVAFLYFFAAGVDVVF